MKGGWVYIMTNKPGGVLYIGVTADIAARVHQHRAGEGSAFCRRYNLQRLVLAEPYPTIDEAITREKALKEWQRLENPPDRTGQPRLGRSVGTYQRLIIAHPSSRPSPG